MSARALFALCFMALARADVMQLTCEQIQQLVDGHNQRRLALASGEVDGQPPASDMTMMLWSEALAEKAKTWANKEYYGHNPVKTMRTDSGMVKTGENIYWLGTTNGNAEFDLDEPLKSWWNEYESFTYKKLEVDDFQQAVQIGHYTQMAWSNTTHVGCGVAKYWRRRMLNYYIVCNYQPPGNYLGQAPYAAGSARSSLACGVDDCSPEYGSQCSDS